MQPGDRVDVAMTKWGGGRHWEYAGQWLGRDVHGDWFAVPAGTPHARPGASFVSSIDSVSLVPSGHAWLAGFSAPGQWCEVYVDVATPAVWDGATLRSTDLDLDVVRLPDGTVHVDDEDEFAEHRVTLGYPPEVVTLAQRTCAAVHAAVRAATPPFDAATPRRWLDRLADLRSR